MIITAVISRMTKILSLKKNLYRFLDRFSLRQYYFPKTRLARSLASLSQILQGELEFTLEDPHSKKVEESLLTFNVAMVGHSQYHLR